MKVTLDIQGGLDAYIKDSVHSGNNIVLKDGSVIKISSSGAIRIFTAVKTLDSESSAVFVVK